MNIQNYLAVTASFIALFSAIYKMVIEPSIDAKISALELNLSSKISNLATTDLITTDNLKDKFNDKIINLDRKVDMHLQDYANYKDAGLLQHNGLNEKINHNWSKTEKLFNQK